MRVRQYGRAELELAKVGKVIGRDPIMETMQGRVLIAQGKSRAALDFYRGALDAYPAYRALIYDYSSALIDNGQADAALNLIASRLLKDPKDFHLYQLRARSYAALGRNLLQHQAQAEAYYLAGNLPAAIDQLQLAEKSGDGNFYSRSMVEARLKELKDMAAGMNDKKKR